MKRKKKLKKSKFTISSEDIRKMEKAIEREIRLENGEYRPSTVHKTSKKDQTDRQSNTVKKWTDND